MSSHNFSATPLLPEVLDGITPKSTENTSDGDSDHVHVVRCDKTLDFFLSESEVKSGCHCSVRVGSLLD